MGFIFEPLPRKNFENYFPHLLKHNLDMGFLGFESHSYQNSDLSGSLNIYCMAEFLGHCIPWRGNPLSGGPTMGSARSLDPFVFGCFAKFCSTSLLLPLHRCSLFNEPVPSASPLGLGWAAELEARGIRFYVCDALF